MVFGIYVIKDVKFFFMFCMVDMNDVIVICNFENVVCQFGFLLVFYFNDFFLFKFGIYDDISGFLDFVDFFKLFCDVVQCLFKEV